MASSTDGGDAVGTISHSLTPPQVRKALLALSVGGFAIGTGEFVIMGLLPDAAADLAISIPDAGHLISIYALGVVIGAPLLAVLGARWPRRRLLIALMLFFGLGNLVSSVAPGGPPAAVTPPDVCADGLGLRSASAPLRVSWGGGLICC